MISFSPLKKNKKSRKNIVQRNGHFRINVTRVAESPFKWIWISHFMRRNFVFPTPNKFISFVYFYARKIISIFSGFFFHFSVSNDMRQREQCSLLGNTVCTTIFRQHNQAWPHSNRWTAGTIALSSTKFGWPSGKWKSSVWKSIFRVFDPMSAQKGLHWMRTTLSFWFCFYNVWSMVCIFYWKMATNSIDFRSEYRVEFNA